LVPDLYFAPTSIGIPMQLNFKRTRVLGLIVGAVAIAACENLDQPPQVVRRYGSIVIEGENASETTVRATAKAIFFESTIASVPSSITAQNDQCTVTNVDTTEVEVLGQKDVGPALSLTVGSQTISMPWVPGGSRYDSPVATPFVYTTGQTAQVSVPGNADVYPAGSVSVLLAEPILAPDVTVSLTQPMVITWNASTSQTSAVLLSLRYANPGNAGYGNQQIVCQLKDDGLMELPASSLATFLQSPNIHRSLTLTRFRTSEVQLDDRTLLHISTQTDTLVKLK
jgi:hypothetical protein